jgi:hypothetical protein
VATGPVLGSRREQVSMTSMSSRPCSKTGCQMTLQCWSCYEGLRDWCSTNRKLNTSRSGHGARTSLSSDVTARVATSRGIIPLCAANQGTVMSVRLELRDHHVPRPSTVHGISNKRLVLGFFELRKHERSCFLGSANLEHKI